MITIQIEAVERASDIEQESLSLEKGTLSKQPSIFSFTMKGVKTMPAISDTIVVKEDGDKVFSGKITERKEILIGNKMLAYQYTCTDGVFDFDSQLVSKAYNDTTAGAIAQDLVDNFSSGFTLDTPATSPTIKTARFNYEQPSRVMQKLADQIGWLWYIDEDQVIHFVPPETMTAPFEVNDTNGKIIFNSLKFDTNITELRNQVYVRGGEYLDPISEDDAVDVYEADGEQNAFPLVYRYENVEVTVNGVAQQVGVDYINQLIGDALSIGTASSTTASKLVDSSASFVSDGVSAGDQVYNTTDETYAIVESVDSQTELTLNKDIFVSGENYSVNEVQNECLYNFQEKSVRFPQGRLLGTDIVAVFGDAKVPLVVQAKDDDSIVAYGLREGVEIRKDIESIEEAETLAYSLIERWRDGSSEGKFKTREKGLQVGQQITIDSDTMGVTDSYKINKITGRMNGSSEFVYTVEFIKSGQTKLVDMLIDLIGKNLENIEISPDEVVQKFQQVSDTFGVTDEIVSVTKTSPPYHWGPVSAGTEGKYNFATWT